jgi:transposase
MNNPSHYSTEFKKSAVQKLLNRGNRTVKEVYTDIGVSISTIYKWRSEFANIHSDMTKSKKSNKGLLDKLHLLMEYSKLSTEDQGVFLRREGIKSAELEQWKNKLTMNKDEEYKKDLTDLKKRNAQLEKEIRRKDKALAEATALLILKKKADLIWGTEDDE